MKDIPTRMRAEYINLKAKWTVSLEDLRRRSQMNYALKQFWPVRKLERQEKSILQKCLGVEL